MDGTDEQPTHRRDDVVVERVGEQVRLQAPDGGVTLSADEAQDLAGRLLEAAAQVGGEESDDRDWARLPMQYLKMGVEEEPETDDATPRSGVIHCWIKDQTRTNALHVACGWIGDDGWFVTDLMDQRPVSRADYETDPARPYYEQALIDDEVFLYEIDGTDDAADEESADEPQ